MSAKADDNKQNWGADFYFYPRSQSNRVAHSLVLTRERLFCDAASRPLLSALATITSRRGAFLFASERGMMEGFIYFLKSELGYCKIGRSSDLPKRMQTFAVKLPFEVELFHSFYAFDSVEAERKLHWIAQCWRVSGEWFLFSDSQLNLFLPISFYKDGDFFTSSGEKYLDFYILA